MTKQMITVSLIIVIAALALAAYWFFLKPEVVENPWQPVITAYSTDCTQGCETVRPAQTGRHGSQWPLVYNPRVDDAVAQWGDCIASVMTCVDAGQSADACIRQSRCPAQCLSRYDRVLAGRGTEDASLDAFEAVFIKTDAVCRPPPRQS